MTWLQVYTALFTDSHYVQFLFCMAIALPLTATVTIFFMNVLPAHYLTYDTSTVHRRTTFAFAILTLIAIYVCALSCLCTFILCCITSSSLSLQS